MELIADGQHVHPDVWPLIVRLEARGPDGARQRRVVDRRDGRGTRRGRWHRRSRSSGTACTVAGTTTLAGSVIALDSAVRNLVALGVSLPRAVAAASRNPLAVVGVTDRGRLAPGQRADLVELDEGLGVVAVTKAGVRRTT